MILFYLRPKLDAVQKHCSLKLFLFFFRCGSNSNCLTDDLKYVRKLQLHLPDPTIKFSLMLHSYLMLTSFFIFG